MAINCRNSKLTSHKQGSSITYKKFSSHNSSLDAYVSQWCLSIGATLANIFYLILRSSSTRGIPTDFLTLLEKEQNGTFFLSRLYPDPYVMASTLGFCLFSLTAFQIECGTFHLSDFVGIYNKLDLLKAFRKNLQTGAYISFSSLEVLPLKTAVSTFMDCLFFGS